MADAEEGGDVSGLDGGLASVEDLIYVVISDALRPPLGIPIPQISKHRRSHLVLRQSLLPTSLPKSLISLLLHLRGGSHSFLKMG